MSFEQITSLKANNKEWVQVEVFRLRKEGLDYDEIGRELKIPERTVRRILDAVLYSIVSPLVAEFRALELARLEEAHKKIWPQVLSGNLRAVDRFLRISQARRQLMGLDRPVNENDEDRGPTQTIIEVLPSPPEDGDASPEAVSPSDSDVAVEATSHRPGGWDGSREDLAGTAVAAR